MKQLTYVSYMLAFTLKFIYIYFLHTLFSHSPDTLSDTSVPVSACIALLFILIHVIIIRREKKNMFTA